MSLDSTPAYSAFNCGDLGLAYNEAAFRHFLGLERRRASQSRRSLLLVLVNGRMAAGCREPLAEQAAHVFRVLGACVREVDFVGWYRENAVAAAVITLTASAPPDVTRQIGDRVSKRLALELPHPDVARLRVRVARFAGAAKVRH